ncbi:MAG: Glu-tRNA(Gln) amidotransferase subunit GatE [Candidatus ainarchaeum sp.]|nr:Glu-tRNA(Gln) amidotransferase subunit GatE [Candidatus ainarchaeum sp.]
MDLDYSKLGLKVGLECHQQLDVGKLFCSCPSNINDGPYEYSITRKLRPVASEKGEFDKAALQEFNKNLEYIYEFHKDYACLVELDEEPPHELNKVALKAVLEVALKTNATIFDIVYIMRKMVINGSNTTGFQRTMQVAKDGILEVNGKKIGVESICLEEDACKIIEQGEGFVRYGLDRLGIPLIEFTTAPDIKSPEEAKEVAMKIGELFRITGFAKRGLGTIRQDINISIKGGARIEIKGVQELDLIDVYVRNEVIRQEKILEIGKKISIPKIELKDLTTLLAKSESKMIKTALSKGQVIVGSKVTGSKGLLGTELQPNKRLATDLSDFIKVKCGVGGLIHCDELPNYGITESEVGKIRKELGCKEKDGFIFVIVASREKAEACFKGIVERLEMLKKGVPEETRAPNEDGTTKYMRPLPGAARMYPETDIPFIQISAQELKKKVKELPRWYSERVKLYISMGLNKQLSEQVAQSNHAREFESYIGLYDILSLAELTLLLDKESIGEVVWILDAQKDGKVHKNDFKLLLEAQMQGLSPKEILEKFERQGLSAGVKEIIKRYLEKNKDFIKQRKESALNPMMGPIIQEIVKQTGKKPEMKELSEFIRAEVKKYI